MSPRLTTRPWRTTASQSTAAAAARLAGAEGLARQKLPVAAVLHPDLHDADLGRARLAVALELDGVGVAGDGVVAGDLDLGVADGDRLVGRLLAGDDVDELLLGLDAAAGMAVAQLVGDQ